MAAVDRLQAPGIAGSAAFHGLVVLTFVLAGGLHSRPPLPPVYKVTLVAPLGTPAPAAPAPAPAAPPKPAASTREPAPTEPRLVRPEPAKRESPPPAARRPPETAPVAPPKATPTPAPVESGSPSGVAGGADVATIRTEGVEFPFPGYLRNLVSQVYRRWRPPTSNAMLSAEVFFLVHRDGSVTDLQFMKRSGSFAFDLEAQGAVEAAARAGAFGSLPGGYGPDVLPVSFFFNPRLAP
jgi:protein TonB